MAKEIKLPEVSENVETGDIVKVLVNVGDTITVDQPIIELETDKAMFEIPATEGGTVSEIKVKEGDKIKIGDVILTVDGNGTAPKKEEPKESDTSDRGEKKEEPPKEEVKEEQPVEEEHIEEVYDEPIEEEVKAEEPKKEEPKAEAKTEVKR